MSLLDMLTQKLEEKEGRIIETEENADEFFGRTGDEGDDFFN